MKKYSIIIVALSFVLACKPTANTNNSAPSLDIDFGSTPPGTLNWSANAGWDANGTFDQWTITSFDAKGGDYSKIEAEIAVNISSVNHDDKGLENHLRQNDYLGAKKHPVGLISIKGANYNEDKDEYNTEATVSIKGSTRTVPLKFSVTKGNPDIIKGSGNLLRQDYNVGDDEGVRNDVGISFEFNAPK